MLSRWSFASRVVIVVFGGALLLSVGCNGDMSTPAERVQKPAEQGAPVEMQTRATPPRQPRNRDEIVEAIPATPAVPATPLVPPRPAEDRVEAAAPSETLGIGDAAPPLAVATWVTGDALEGFEVGTVTVVEFWATWCGPCRTSMPHISELQEQYGDAVRFVGVTREELDVVEAFLGQEQSEGATWAEAITYRLAIDEDSTTNTAYMKAAGQNGIPCAFIVGKDGVVEWIGHPMTIDKPLEAIVNDSYDREAAAAEMAAKERVDAMSRELFMLQREQKWDEALVLLDTIQSELDELAAPYNAQRLLSMKLGLLSGAGRTDEATALRGELVEAGWDEPRLLNELAWNTALADEPSEADLEVALKAATRAAELTEQTDGSILDTLARVHYAMGDLDQAISWQEQAVEHADGNASIAATLEAYRAERDGTGSAEQVLEGGTTVEVEVR